MAAAEQVLLSMTGAGTAAGPTELGECRIEIRSVNGKTLHTKTRLPGELLAYEAAIEDAVRGVLRRGTVTIAVERVGAGGGLADRAALAALIDELRATARALSLGDDLGVRDLLPLSALLRRESAVQRPLPEQFAALVQHALRDCVAARRREGQGTAQAMRSHLAEIETLRARAAARLPGLVAEYRDRLLQRVRDFVAQQGLQLDPGDLVREVAVFAERTDTSEELQRLAAHSGEVRAVLDRGGEVGRKIEFLLQELLREANTLGSKSPDVELAHTVVAMKAAIDRLKEQAANLE